MAIRTVSTGPSPRSSGRVPTAKEAKQHMRTPQWIAHTRARTYFGVKKTVELRNRAVMQSRRQARCD